MSTDTVSISAQTSPKRTCWWPFVLANVLLVLYWVVENLCSVLGNVQVSGCWESVQTELKSGCWILALAGMIGVPIGSVLLKRSWRLCNYILLLMLVGALYSLLWGVASPPEYGTRAATLSWKARASAAYMGWIQGMFLIQLPVLLLVRTLIDAKDKSAKRGWRLVLHLGMIVLLLVIVLALFLGLLLAFSSLS